MSENALFVNQPQKKVDGTSFEYDVDAPVVPMKDSGENLVPNDAASEDALLASFIEYGSPAAEQVQAIQQEYSKNGASSIIEDIRSRGAERRNQEVINNGLDAVTNGDMSVEQLTAELEATAAVTPDEINDLHQEYLTARLFRNTAKTPEDKVIAQEKIAELVTKGYPVDRIIADRVEWLKSTLDPNAISLGAGILADIIPFATTIPFVRAFNKVFPDEPLSFFDLPRGELAIEIRRRLEAMEPDERFQVATDFMDAIMDNDSALTGQDFQRMLILQEALEGEFGTVDRVIGDAITILDSIGAAGVAKGLFRIGKSMFRPGSVVDTVSLVDDLAASELAASGIRTDMKAALGMDQIEMIEVAAGVTNWKKDITLLPGNIIRMLNRGKEQSLDLINRTRGNALIIKESEKSVAAQAIRGQLQTVGQNGFYGSNFTAQKLDDGLAFTAKYGVVDAAGNTKPFTSAIAAQEAAKHTFPTATNLKIFRKTPKGLLVEVKPKQINKRAGEYVYEIEGFKPYATVLNPTDKIFFQEGDILASGPLVKYGLDPASRQAKWMSDAFAQAGDQGRGIRFQLAQIAKPFSDISDTKKREVLKLLDKYSRESATMDTSAIMRAAGDDMEVLRGFFSYRQTMDSLWHLENRAFREDMVLQGAKHLVIDDFATMGVKQSEDALLRAVGRGANKQVEVYDAVKGSMVKLDAQQVNKMLADGKSIYKMREPVGDISRQSNLVIISKADQVRELPAAVLKKIDGYIPRHYKETYWVRKIVQGTKNGRASQNFQVLRAVGDKAEANQVVRELQASGKLTPEEAERAITHDRALNPTERATIEQQDQISLGRMFYHKRADQRVRGVDGFAEISDPVEAMVKNIDSTSRFVGNDQLLSTMKTRWMNTFGKQLGLVETNKGFPLNRNDIGSSLSGTPAEKAQALEMWDHIVKTESISTWEGEQWRNFWITAVDKIIGESAADTIVGQAKQLGTWPMKLLAENSPNKLIRSVAFYHLIAGNPIRQAYVQAQQFMFISALAPKQAPKIIVQNKAVMLGLLRDASPAVYKASKNASAKVMGMSTKEYDNFIDQYIKTGIPKSVDSHDYVANALVEYSKNVSGNIAQRALRKGWNMGLAPFKLAKKVGFDYGELSNLTSTFLLARNRFLKANPGKKQLTTTKDFQVVAADARNLALDMTRSGAFRYQDGALSALTQFLSIQHKALLAISPFKSVGNRAFTLAERRKLAVGQLILNGVTGLGLYELYKGVQNYTGNRVDEKYEKFIVGGMYEYVMNNIFRVITGEEDMQDLNVAGAIAPASGINQKMGDMAEVLLNNEPWTDMFAGTNVVNRWIDMAKTMSAMQKFPTLNNDEDFKNMLSNFASITSGWNQFIKARAAMRLGWHVNTSGSPTVQASYGSAIVEGTLGISPRTLDEMYSLQDEYSNRVLRENHLFPDADTETTQVAAAMYKSMSRTVTIFQDEFDPDIAALDTDQLTRLHLQRMNEGLQMMASIKALYTPIERDRIWQKFQDIAKEDRTRSTTGLIDTILKKIVVGDVSGDQVLPVISRIRAAGLIEPGSAEDQRISFIIEELFKSMQGREELSNFNNEQIQDIYNGSN